MSNDNFDTLWANMKERVREARGEREALYTDGGIFSNFGLRLNVDKPTPRGVILSAISGKNEIAVGYLNREDLLNHAAQCIAAAEEVEESKSETK